MTVRTRIAPSPTGDPHVGTAYIALFNYCFARHHGGRFVLRIEDTDSARSSAESERMILDALRWVGVEWDEGPDVGGERGPYRQGERSAIYRRHVDILLEKGHAFRCFCTPERLAEVRGRQMTEGSGALGYDGRCVGLDASESARRIEAGESYVVRMKVPTEGCCVVSDRLRGEIEIGWDQVDMQVLLKSDGMPTYHLANVVDDHLMEITHVIRGEEWISSTPKHVLLYQYFGWTQPVFCHLPLLRNPDKSKLSKRKNPTSILYYERMGYLPEALLNYLGMMAWSMPDGEEKFTLEQMIELFDIGRVSLGGPVFDIKKLSWLNGRWIREALDTGALVARLAAWATKDDRVHEIVEMSKQRVERLSDFGPLVLHFFAGDLAPTAEQFALKGAEPEEFRRMLVYGLWRLDTERAWEKDAVEAALRDLAGRMDHKLRVFLRPFFVALSGNVVSTPLFDTMAVLGRDVTRARLREGIVALGGLSGKQEKKWRKAFDQLMAEPVSEP